MEKSKFSLRQFLFYFIPISVFSGYIGLSVVSGLLSGLPQIDVGSFLDYRMLIFQAFIFIILLGSVLLGITLKQELDFSEFGVKKFDLKVVFAAFGVSLIIYTINLAFGLLFQLIKGGFEDYSYMVGTTANLSFPLTLAGIIFLATVVGYAEELFFRSYLFVVMKKLPSALIVLFSSAFFSIGHIYQGIEGVVVTFFIGIFLGIIYLKTRNLHLVAIAHALYDVFAFMFVYFTFLGN
ncbi:MAG: CPBP family intramembrane metalloprotease [Spirochaetales bacterium]|nr:CPBP family intramembrane metalloprotease [Spirochaetales bacterium]